MICRSHISSFAFPILAVLVFFPASARASDPVRLSFEWIELNFEDLTDLISDNATTLRGENLRDEVERLINRNQAAKVRTAVVNARSGQRAKGESIETFVYAEQFTVPQLSEDGKLAAMPVPDKNATRNIGVTVETDPVISADGRTVEIQMAHELVSLLEGRKWGSGIAEVEMPQFYSMSGLTNLRVRKGETRLVGSFRPHESLRREGEESTDPRLLLFVTANFMADASNAEPKAEASDFAMHYEFIETDMATLNRWIVDENVAAEGAALRERFARAIGEGDARLVENAVAAGSEGKVEIQSVREVLYPTDYDPPEVDRRVPAMPGAFEEWNVGLQIEFQAEWQDDGTLHISPDERSRRGRKVGNHILRWDHEIGEQRWMEGVAEVVFPLFYEMKLQQPLNLVPGEIALLGTLRPHSEDSKQPILAVFVKARRLDL